MSEGLSYDEASLVTQLSALSSWQRTAFAAACAQRLAPVFRRYAEAEGLDAEATGVVEVALDQLWADLAGEPIAGDKLVSLAAQCVDAVPDEEDWNEWAELADDAAAAAAYALRARTTGEPQESVWASRCAYDAAYALAGVRLGAHVVDAEVQRQVRESEPVQRELRNQAEDLRMARGSRDGDPQTVAELRARATAQASLLVEDAILSRS